MLCSFCFQKKDVIQFILFSDDPYEISLVKITEQQHHPHHSRQTSSPSSSSSSSSHSPHSSPPSSPLTEEEEDTTFDDLVATPRHGDNVKTTVPTTISVAAHQRSEEKNHNSIGSSFVENTPPTATTPIDESENSNHGISVDILPTYRRDVWLDRALSLFLGQTLPPPW